MIIFRLANLMDIEHLVNFPIQFHYKKDIAEEISGSNAQHFRWVVGEDEERICAFHRTMLVAGWGFWGGVFVAPWIEDPWLMYNLLKFAHADLRALPLEGQLAWTDSPEVPKAVLLRRLGFTENSLRINRLMYVKTEVLARFRAVHPKGGVGQWRHSMAGDYPQIVELAKGSPTFITTLPAVAMGDLERWYVYEEDRIKAAINWWRHEETLEIHFVLAETAEFDVADGIIRLLGAEITDEVKIVKVNFEASRKITFLRLVMFGANTYSCGFESTLYRYREKL